jgi:hypothetical protein
MESGDFIDGDQERVDTAEILARRLYETHERLAPSFGYESGIGSPVPFDQLPANCRNLLIAVCYQIQHGNGADSILLRAVEAEVRDAWEAVRRCYEERDGAVLDGCGNHEDRFDTAVIRLIAVLDRDSL